VRFHFYPRRSSTKGRNLDRWLGRGAGLIILCLVETGLSAQPIESNGQAAFQRNVDRREMEEPVDSTVSEPFFFKLDQYLSLFTPNEDRLLCMMVTVFKVEIVRRLNVISRPQTAKVLSAPYSWTTTRLATRWLHSRVSLRIFMRRKNSKKRLRLELLKRSTCKRQQLCCLRSMRIIAHWRPNYLAPACQCFHALLQPRSSSQLR